MQNGRSFKQEIKDPDHRDQSFHAGEYYRIVT